MPINGCIMEDINAESPIVNPISIYEKLNSSRK